MAHGGDAMRTDGREPAGLAVQAQHLVRPDGSDEQCAARTVLYAEWEDDGNLACRPAALGESVALRAT